jgi:hypothetical protein
MTESEWLQMFAAAAGSAPLTSEDRDAILELAGIAAHASERTAAPLTCWAACSVGLTPTDAVALARSLADEPRPS